MLYIVSVGVASLRNSDAVVNTCDEAMTMNTVSQFSEWTICQADRVLADVRSELRPDDDGTQFDRLLGENLMPFTPAEADQIEAAINIRLSRAAGIA